MMQISLAKLACQVVERCSEIGTGSASRPPHLAHLHSREVAKDPGQEFVTVRSPKETGGPSTARKAKRPRGSGNSERQVGIDPVAGPIRHPGEQRQKLICGRLRERSCLTLGYRKPIPVTKSP